MRIRKSQLLLSMITLFACVMTVTKQTSADEVRFYEENGITYRETKTKIKKPVYETRWENRKQTVLREQYVTENREATRTLHTPVTEYHWVPKVRNRWNPFLRPTVEYRMVPVTSWRSQNEVYTTPVTRREVVQETRTVPRQVTTMKMVEEEVTRRVAVAPTRRTIVRRTTASPIVAERQYIGGRKLTGDPPRLSSGWRSIDTIRR